MTASHDIEERVAAFVALQSEPAPVKAWVSQITEGIFEEFPAIADDAALAEIVRKSAMSQWRAFLVSMNQPQNSVPMLPSAAEMAIEIARRGYSLPVLFRVYRIARRGVWEYITEVLMSGSLDAETPAFLIFFWNRLSSWIDSVVDASSLLFEAERDRVRQGAAAQRLDAVRRVLEGNALGTAREVSAALGGYPISGFNTAILLHASDLDRVDDLREAAVAVARSVGQKNPLVVSPGGRDLWVWLGTTKLPDIASLVAARPDLDSRGITAAIGTPSEGLEGFRQSHLEAQRAQRIGFAAHGLPNPLYFAHIETLAMLWNSGADAVRFVQRTLGELARDDEAMTRLRLTVRVVLNADSIEKAAEILIVHKNTVRYRLNQVEKILGRDIAESPIDLALALNYHEAFLAGGEDVALPEN